MRLDNYPRVEQMPGTDPNGSPFDPSEKVAEARKEVTSAFPKELGQAAFTVDSESAVIKPPEKINITPELIARAIRMSALINNFRDQETNRSQAGKDDYTLAA